MEPCKPYKFRNLKPDRVLIVETVGQLENAGKERHPMPTCVNTVLLTGGTGFLGSNLLNRLVASGIEVVLLKRATSNVDRIVMLLPRVTVYDIQRETLMRIFHDHAIGSNIHCATNYGRGESDPCHMLEANLFLPLTLLELGRKHGVRCFINTDTVLETMTS